MLMQSYDLANLLMQIQARAINSKEVAAVLVIQLKEESHV